MEITRCEDGHLEGSVASDDQDPVPFSGTLELLKVLDDIADGGATGLGLAGG
jgi:hypothetical protein